MKTAIVYARYSDSKQSEQSIEGQLRVCKEYAERNDIAIVDTYIDRAMTGTNDNRAAFQKMLKDSSKKAWNYVIVYKLDRFSRDKYETAMHRHTLKMNGVKLLSAMENIPDTPEGIILESLLEGMNQYYSAELAQKVRRGMRETRNKGNFPGGTVMYGYKVENHKVVINEEEAEIVKYIFTESAAGKLGTTIIDELKERGVFYKGKPFAKTTFYRLITNEKYIGIFRHGDEVFTNIYPPIVPTDVFEIVKSRLDSNKYGKHKPEVCYLLKNKLRCGYCGKPVSSESGTSKSGAVMRYYKCNTKKARESCILNQIRKDLIENLVINVTYEVLKEAVDLSALAEMIFAAHKKRLDDQSLLNLLITDYTEVEKAINNLLNAMEQGIITSSTKERLEKLEEKKSELSVKLAAEKARNKLLITKEDIVNYLQKQIKKRPKQLIDAFVKEVVLYNDKVEIYYNYIDKEPDGDNHQAFSFYNCNKTFVIDKRKIGGEPETLTFDVELFI